MEADDKRWCILRHSDSDLIGEIFSGKRKVYNASDGDVHPLPPFEYFIPFTDMKRKPSGKSSSSDDEYKSYDAMLDERALRNDLHHFIFICATKEQVLAILDTRDLSLLYTHHSAQFFLSEVLAFASLSDGSANSIQPKLFFIGITFRSADFANQLPLGSRRLSLGVPKTLTFVNISNSGTFIVLLYNCHPCLPSGMCRRLEVIEVLLSAAIHHFVHAMSCGWFDALFLAQSV